MITSASSSSASNAVTALQWQITWTLAFPTLVSSLLFTHDHEPVWQLLAWRALTSHHVRTSRRLDDATAAPVSVVETAWQESIGYGEITPSTVLAILHWLRQQQLEQPCLKLPEQACIVDLGSGNGNVLLAASLAIQMSQAIGLELLPQLHNQAMDNVEHWELVNCSVATVDWELACADFTVHNDWIHQADFVFIHATVFQESLLQTLNKLCQACLSGTIFCLVSRPLKEEGGIRTVADFQLDMNWGIATVFLQQKSRGSASVAEL